MTCAPNAILRLLGFILLIFTTLVPATSAHSTTCESISALDYWAVVREGRIMRKEKNGLLSWMKGRPVFDYQVRTTRNVYGAESNTFVVRRTEPRLHIMGSYSDISLSIGSQHRFIGYRFLFWETMSLGSFCNDPSRFY